MSVVPKCLDDQDKRRHSGQRLRKISDGRRPESAGPSREAGMHAERFSKHLGQTSLAQFYETVDELGLDLEPSNKDFLALEECVTVSRNNMTVANRTWPDARQLLNHMQEVRNHPSNNRCGKGGWTAMTRPRGQGA